MISKDELVNLISNTTDEVLKKNSKMLENNLEGTIEVSVQLSALVTIKILQELNVLGEIK